MQAVSKVEKLFSLMNESAELISKELNCTYIEAVAETGENLFQGEVLQEDMSEIAKKNLAKKYEQSNIRSYEKEEIRKAFQLVILKGLKEGAHANHQMTPDTVGLFTGYLVNKFASDQKEISILDPAVGTGNLLTAVLNHLKQEQTESFGVEVDDLLIKLAFLNANLGEHSVQFYNQDSLEPLYIDPVDYVICDLPIGYYPNDVGADKFKLKADSGHSYSHHLFIEQSINYTKAGGYLFFIVPNHLFESKEAPKLKEYLKEQVIVQGLLQLPESLFKDKQHAKSIFILQKKGEGVAAPKQAMLAELPKFSDKAGMQSIMKQLDSWFAENKK
ncbi:class I SAM-dependent methyltransferase [Metabacillus idriensis]|uniref:class I SAM-dependent methyltransferase n=1 Tax=Bacillaceae TaxID=186817 RepID=UPI001059A2DE|nr:MULTISPECIES: class I SAM-dependent methyltransferase [Bacillaceae]MDR0138061.1 class I SAM-dependent methyltransferase [Metabacillus idriensis]TDL76528.1 class I SAM-dependent methyltransferase [Peribacillus frigoritolerans]